MIWTPATPQRAELRLGERPARRHEVLAAQNVGHCAEPGVGDGERHGLRTGCLLLRNTPAGRVALVALAVLHALPIARTAGRAAAPAAFNVTRKRAAFSHMLQPTAFVRHHTQPLPSHSTHTCIRAAATHTHTHTHTHTLSLSLSPVVATRTVGCASAYVNALVHRHAPSEESPPPPPPSRRRFGAPRWALAPIARFEGCASAPPACHRGSALAQPPTPPHTARASRAADCQRPGSPVSPRLWPCARTPRSRSSRALPPPWSHASSAPSSSS